MTTAKTLTDGWVWPATARRMHYADEHGHVLCGEHGGGWVPLSRRPDHAPLCKTCLKRLAARERRAAS